MPKSFLDSSSFIPRHIGPKDAEVAHMLDVLGCASLDDLVQKVLPATIREQTPPDIGAPLSEHEALQKLFEMARKNEVKRSLIGMGYADTITPPVILRNVLQNPSWYTAYTPYQPEISQGRLEALLAFQQMVMDFTGMEIANASMLDEATAAAEAMTLAKRVGKSNSNLFCIAESCHPQTIAVVETRARALNIDTKVCSVAQIMEQPEDYFAVLVQYPATDGSVQDLSLLAQAAHEKQALVCVASDLLALALLAPPGEWGADIVVGSAQRFGVPLGFGGPHAAFFATRDAFKRSMPGRLVGVSVDSTGKSALRLALQTREQHIRRDKATSNICTAQVLLANVAALYAVYHGPQGIKNIATRLNRLALCLAKGLERLGFTPLAKNYFDTLTIDAGDKAAQILLRAQESGFNLRDFGDRRLGITLDEKSTPAEIEKLWHIFASNIDFDFEIIANSLGDSDHALPSNLVRRSEFLTHPIFNLYHSETEMMRYLRRLAQKDIALDRSMIPLGSCTMKLNASAEMMPISWPEFCDIHPFAPQDQTKGYQWLLNDFEQKLCRLTGFDAVSLQPNAGSQGEYAGLLAIARWHESRGESHRNVCLIPSSAHGTNPASAVLAGMRVVIVQCDDQGNVDVADLEKRAQEHSQDLAALMITYPSTHGVFEEEIKRICQIVHDNGGQVYMDGANFNAMVGLALPAKLGADVMHMNLHKTFCIPHGGGGPGVGPIGVAKHLAPFLPENPLHGSEAAPVSAATYGSASILPISWMYISMMGAEGLKKATQVAILNANYIAKKLQGFYQTLYTGKNGFVAHECILDTRDLKNTAGITVDDIAKRLMDFGFHAPTMSFPVPGTLMVEPTESESLAELERFIDAMIRIRKEISKIESKNFPTNDNPLVNAPHTALSLVAEEWNHPYSREEALYPAPWVKEDKYWPPVSRIDHAAGDRNLICTCPPIESYQD